MTFADTIPHRHRPISHRRGTELLRGPGMVGQNHPALAGLHGTRRTRPATRRGGREKGHGARSSRGRHLYRSAQAGLCRRRCRRLERWARLVAGGLVEHRSATTAPERANHQTGVVEATGGQHDDEYVRFHAQNWKIFTTTCSSLHHYRGRRSVRRISTAVCKSFVICDSSSPGEVNALVVFGWVIR